jgi:hypothetical protein
MKNLFVLLLIIVVCYAVFVESAPGKLKEINDLDQKVFEDGTPIAEAFRSDPMTKVVCYGRAIIRTATVAAGYGAKVGGFCKFLNHSSDKRN